jgi:hypothetical protein
MEPRERDRLAPERPDMLAITISNEKGTAFYGVLPTNQAQALALAAAAEGFDVTIEAA